MTLLINLCGLPRLFLALHIGYHLDKRSEGPFACGRVFASQNVIHKSYATMLWLRLRFHCDVRSVSALLCLFFFAFVLRTRPLPLRFASAIGIAFAFASTCFGSVFVALYTRSGGARCLRFKSIRKQIKTFQDLYAQLSKSARVRLSAQGRPQSLSLLLQDSLKQRYLWLCNASCIPLATLTTSLHSQSQSTSGIQFGNFARAGTKRAQQSQHTLH